MAILDAIKGIFSGGKVLETVGGIVDNLTLSKEEKAKLNIELTKAINDHNEKMAELSQRELESYLKEMDSARNMQVEALKQGDAFSKHFIYYLAAGLVLLTFAWDFCLFKVDYPERNRDLVIMITGVLNSTALVSILNFFFGSSQGSKSGTQRMDKMVDKMMEK